MTDTFELSFMYWEYKFHVSHINIVDFGIFYYFPLSRQIIIVIFGNQFSMQHIFPPQLSIEKKWDNLILWLTKWFNVLWNMKIWKYSCDELWFYNNDKFYNFDKQYSLFNRFCQFNRKSLTGALLFCNEINICNFRCDLICQLMILSNCEFRSDTSRLTLVLMRWKAVKRLINSIFRIKILDQPTKVVNTGFSTDIKSTTVFIFRKCLRNPIKFTRFIV